MTNVRNSGPDVRLRHGLVHAHTKCQCSTSHKVVRRLYFANTLSCLNLLHLRRTIHLIVSAHFICMFGL